MDRTQAIIELLRAEPALVDRLMAEVLERCKSTGNFEAYVETANTLRSLDIISDAQLARYLAELPKEAAPRPAELKGLPGFLKRGETQVLHEAGADTVVRDGRLTCITRSGTQGTAYFDAEPEIRALLERSSLEGRIGALEASEGETERIMEALAALEAGAEL